MYNKKKRSWSIPFQFNIFINSKNIKIKDILLMNILKWNGIDHDLFFFFLFLYSFELSDICISFIKATNFLCFKN